MTDYMHRTDICCEIFLDITDRFKWFITDDGKYRLMPCIVTESGDYRANYCPSCGAYIRNIKTALRDAGEEDL